MAGEVHATAQELERRLDHAIATGVTRHRQGAEEVGVSETLIAVRLAQALSALTGVGWEQILEARAEHHRSTRTEA